MNKTIFQGLLLRVGLCLAPLFFPALCLAEGISGQVDTSQPVKNRPEMPQYLPEKPGGGFSLPPAPVLPEATVGGPAFALAGVAFEGNTVFSNAELQALAQPLVGKRVGMAELEELRYRLTKLYVDAGYINSGAVIMPGRKVENGVVRYTIEEGKLNRIDVQGNERLRAAYVQKRLWPDAERPFNTQELQDNFQLLLQDPLIERLDGRLRPGASPGEGILDLDVHRALPYGLGFSVDNHRPPSTGSMGGTFSGWLRNLTGYGDMLDASFGLSEGTDDYGLGFSLPLNAYETRLSLRYSRNSNSVVEEPLGNLDIKSESRDAELTLAQPLFRDQRSRLELGLTLANRESKTWLLGEPFSFSQGVEDGESRVTVLRFFQSWLDRTPSSALALRSTFNFGLNMFDATIQDGDVPDGRFMAWLGQAQYAHRLGERFGQIILRGDVQLSNDTLLALEQFALGGAGSVRGYRENELVRDNGYVLSAEWRYPLIQRQEAGSQMDILQGGPFMDFGMAWNNDESAGDNTLHSVGLGLLWTPNKQFSVELYWAHNIKAATVKEEYDLQDDGIHFLLRYNVF
ncbi:MAG: ShlB/FhaC/HecB family hemolysin secretion/activation protein [Desulfurivibrionaceae bacterium]|jgi:hemolysin activation/secretion protein